MKYEDLESPYDFSARVSVKRGWEAARQWAHEYFMQKYFKLIPNETSEMIKRMRMFIPGRIYTYQYDPLYRNKLDFYDERPVMLCIKTYIHPKTNNNIQLGLNLNFIPAEIRTYILSKLWEVFAKGIKKDVEGRPENDNIASRQKLLFSPTFDVYGLLDYILGTVGKTYWTFGIRNYIFDRITNPKLIDYDDWGYIPLLSTNEIVGISERELLKIYWREKNKKGK